MENNAVTTELTATLAPACELKEITAVELAETANTSGKVTFTQPTDMSEVKDFSEFVRAEEEVDEPAKPILPIKSRMGSLLAAAAGAMSASAGGSAMWDTFTKLGFGGDMKVVKSKNWGGVLSPERLAAIAEHNALISQNAFNKDRLERKQQKKQAATVLGCKPTKAQKKQLRKARTEGRLTADVSQYSAGVNAFAEQLHNDIHLSQIPAAVAMDEVSHQMELLSTADESTETVSTTAVGEFTQTDLVDNRTNIGDVVTALEVGDVPPTPEKVLLVNDDPVSIRAQVVDVDVERSYPSYKPEESTPVLGPNGEGDDHGSDSGD